MAAHFAHGAERWLDDRFLNLALDFRVTIEAGE